MADPVTAGVSMGLSAAGGIIGGIGAKQEAEGKASMYRYKAGVAMLNKQINEQNAKWATQVGDIQAQQAGLKGKAQTAETKVVQSASGFDVNSGSNKRVRDTQTSVTQYQENVIRWDAAKTSYGYETKATMDKAEADLDMMASEQSSKAGDIAMWTSFINGASNVSSKWMQGKSAGMWG